METTIENPVIKDDSTELRDQLRGMAEEAGPLSGNEFESDTSSATETETRAPVETEKETVSNPDTKPETVTDKPERPRDELGRFTKTEAGIDIPEAERKPAEQKPAEPTPEAKPETAYTKKQKEQERQESLLKNFQKDKETFYAESERIRQQLHREAEQLHQARQQRQAPNAPQSRAYKYSSVELAEAAEDYDQRAIKAFQAGDETAFMEAMEVAKNARQQASQVGQLEQQAAQQAQEQQRQALYHANMDAVIKNDPELLKPETALSQEIVELINQAPILNVIPDGFPIAVQVAKWKLGYEKSAGLISGLEDENKQLKAENARLNGNLSLNGSGPSGPVPTKRFEDMSMDEMKRQLRGVAEEAGSLATA